MARGSVFPSESRSFTDAATGARIRQVTDQPAIHHHPFFFVPAYDDAMARLIFVSHRSGRPEIYAEDRESGRLVQLTERAGLAEYSIYPSHDGRYVYYTAGAGGYRVDTETQREEQLVNFSALGDIRLRERGMVADAMGTTALSFDDRYLGAALQPGRSSASGRHRYRQRRLPGHFAARHHRPPDVLPR